MAKIYPKEAVKIIDIDKEGYNSLTVLSESEDSFRVQLYNPNVEPQEEVAAEGVDTGAQA